MQRTSEVFPGLRVGQRIKSDILGKSGKIDGFVDVVDVDAMDSDNLSEEEATIKGGAIVVLLDEGCRTKMRRDDGSVEEIKYRSVDTEQMDEFEWEVGHE